MSEILIKNALIGKKTADIFIHNGIISAVADEIAATDNVAVIDNKGGIVVPGLVDCHSHIDKSHLNDGGRTVYVHGTGAVKGGLTRQEKAAFTVEDIRQRAEKVIKAAIESGTLFLRTNCDVDSYVGLRGMEALLSLKDEYKDKISLQVAAFAQEGVFQDDRTPKLLNDAMRMGADLIAGHTITCGEGEKHIDFILEMAEKYGTQADFHLDESGNREHYLLPYLAKKIQEMGLENRVNAIHMCTLSALKEDELSDALNTIVGCGLKATVAPTAISTRKIAPVKELLKTGIPIGLGSDNIRDFFNPMGTGNIMQIAYLLCYLQAFFTDEEIEQLWGMVTTEGAKVLGVDYSIKIGAPANLTLYSTADKRSIISGQVSKPIIIRSGKVLS